jgi:hypothetical protein
MIKIRDFIEKTSNDGNQHIIADLMIDSASELPSQEYAGYVLDMGSIAWDISTGDFYALNSEGTWYKQDGSGAYTPDESNASLLSSPLNLGKGVENEPDITEVETSEPDILEEPVEKTTTRKKTSETETKDDGDAV